MVGGSWQSLMVSLGGSFYLFDLCLLLTHGSDKEQAGGQQPLPGILASIQLDCANTHLQMWDDPGNDKEDEVAACVNPCAV